MRLLRLVILLSVFGCDQIDQANNIKDVNENWKNILEEAEKKIDPSGLDDETDMKEMTTEQIIERRYRDSVLLNEYGDSIRPFLEQND